MRVSTASTLTVCCLLFASVALNYLRNLHVGDNPGARLLSSSSDSQRLGFSCTDQPLNNGDLKQSAIAGVASFFEFTRPNNPLLGYLPKHNGPSKDIDYIEYGQTLLWLGGPFIIFSIGALFAWCSYCCTRNSGDERVVTEGPDGKEQKFWYLRGPRYIALLCAAGIICSSSMALYFEGDMASSIQKAECGVLNIFDTVVYGKQGDPWIAVDGINGLLSNVSAILPAVSANLTSSLNDTDFITAGFSVVAVKLSTLQLLLNETQFEANGNIYPCQICTEINSITSYINADMHTQLGGLVSNLESARSDVLEDLSSTALTIQSHTSSVSETVNLTRDSLLSTRESAVELFVSVNEYAIDKRQYATLPALALYVGVTSIAVIAVVLYVMMKVKRARPIYTFSWCCTSFLLVICSLVAAVFLMLSSAMSDGCNLSRAVLSPSGLVKYNGTVYQEPISSVASSCLFGSGDLLNALGIGADLAVGPRLDSTMNAISGVSTSNIQFANLTSLQNKVNSLTIDSFGLHNADIVSAIAALNTYTICTSAADYQVRQTNNVSCTVNDQWVVHDFDCEVGRTLVTPSTDPVSSGSPACCNFNSFDASQAHTRSLHLAAYTSFVSALDNVWAVANGLVNLNASMVQVIAQAKSDMSQINSTTNQFLANVTNLQNIFTTVVQDTSRFVLDDIEALFKGANCSFMASGYRSLESAICEGVVPNFQLTAFAVGLSCVLNIALTAVLVTMRKRVDHRNAVAPLNVQEERWATKVARDINAFSRVTPETSLPAFSANGPTKRQWRMY
eukprot:GILJ01006368.1.p1 GENE.GILJ01006368.1~~GILJ01006368.1.p1  ORF type:complete len:791 (-),score=82.71 GILJ01006368.1:202-2574(-)